MQNKSAFISKMFTEATSHGKKYGYRLNLNEGFRKSIFRFNLASFKAHFYAGQAK